MYKKYLLTILAIILVFIFLESFMGTLNWRFSFWPAILAFILFIFGKKIALIWAIGLGFLQDEFSTLPFGIHLLTFFCLTLILYFLIQKILSNRTFLSLLTLSVIATLLSAFLLYLFCIIGSAIFGNEKLFSFSLQNILVQLLGNIILTIIIFIIIFFLSKKINADWLINK